MPKIKWITAHQHEQLFVPKPDYTLELFRRYQKSQRLTNQDLAVKIGYKNAQAVADKKAQGTSKWSKDTILQWTTALHIPSDELIKAMLLDQK